MRIEVPVRTGGFDVSNTGMIMDYSHRVAGQHSSLTLASSSITKIATMDCQPPQRIKQSREERENQEDDKKDSQHSLIGLPIKPIHPV